MTADRKDIRDGLLSVLVLGLTYAVLGHSASPNIDHRLADCGRHQPNADPARRAGSDAGRR